ncbi:malate synthase G [Pseudoalteromonas luteoviolacea]|uniref:Malate synthase G n=1 Tax=Pseudoalteromonas luteoviolacea TaxID=43657 RepID=A0A1C0TRE5_9GAMM|nr:malate synthase G [Pseudoalteromonas luteoviolacea]OCQ21511.1 malate synthase G [Pseudoalteromonas luteoviolacea]
MSSTIQQAGLTIDSCFYEFVNQELLSGLSLNQEAYWQGVATIINKLTPINRALLSKRDEMQAQIDRFHVENPVWDAKKYRTFLETIGYLQPEPPDFNISTMQVEPEIALVAAPQLVVPVNNARFALNAANARWGSLYDALYGTDMLPEEDGAEKSDTYNPVRGFKVMAYARQFLDKVLPLSSGSHIESTHYAIVNKELVVTLNDSRQVGLSDSTQLIGYQGLIQNPTVLLFKHHGLHFELIIDPEDPVGKVDKAGIKDVILESALTTIMDCEDSVAAVDAQDKIQVYRNWLELNTGTLKEQFEKAGKSITRELNPDRTYTSLDGEQFNLSGRAMMFVRNVGHLMTTPTILDMNCNEVYEGILDGIFTATAALHDLRKKAGHRNSKAASINIVKPKMHGAEEVAYTELLFSEIERFLSLPTNTIKMGIMDEERRTSVNLSACIYAAKSRVVFINTGFLDRTGDEIHTSMYAGAVLPKEQIKSQPWIAAYERQNVEIGLGHGFIEKAQIGKGMWAKPDKMALMMEQKADQLRAGASTAWVPSPTAATLHAMHYHEVDVRACQQAMKHYQSDSLAELLSPPLMINHELTESEIQAELDNNVQGILGYVVRWIDQGIGCSKVPDISHVGLMEDRATLRISSQHITNWLAHGICTEEQVHHTFAKMACVVDSQNSADLNYQAMCSNGHPNAENLSYQAALALVFEGRHQPNGYTEPLLHSYRRQRKALDV